MLKKSQSTKGAPLGGRGGGSEKKFFFRQKFLDSIKISYEKFCFDTTSLTHQNADFPPPPSKVAPPGGVSKKKKFCQMKRNAKKIIHENFGGPAAIFNTLEYSLTHKSSK